MYTVKQISELAGVSIRTLHHYDQIDLLKPARIGENGYRYYDEAALLRLQQVLLYRELGLELQQIREVLDAPDFDLLAALRGHRTVLKERIARLHNLIDTVDSTMMHLTGELAMSKKRMFGAFSEDVQKQYEREARLEYGPEIVNESTRRWGSYDEARRAEIMEEGNQIYDELLRAMHAGLDASSSVVVDLLDRWQEHLRYFYEPNLEILRGLGQLYNNSPDFNANFSKLDPALPEWLETVITDYVDELETAAIQRLLDEDQSEAGSTGRA